MIRKYIDFAGGSIRTPPFPTRSQRNGDFDCRAAQSFSWWYCKHDACANFIQVLRTRSTHHVMSFEKAQQGNVTSTRYMAVRFVWITWIFRSKLPGLIIYTHYRDGFHIWYTLQNHWCHVLWEIAHTWLPDAMTSLTRLPIYLSVVVENETDCKPVGDVV